MAQAARDAAPAVALRRAAGAAPTRGLEDYGAAPDFAGNDRWFNSKPLTLAGLRGRVVLVDFWTYTCINCIRTLPHLSAWDKAYRDEGLTIVGVHSPEFTLRADAGNVARGDRSRTASATRSRRTTSWPPGTPGATSTGRPST